MGPLLYLQKRSFMHIKPLYWGSSATIKAILEVFSRGSAVVASSDTVLGLLAPATQGGRLELDRIKGRFDKPYIVFAADQDQAHSFVDWQQVSPSLPLKKLMETCWPGPITFICPASQEISSFLGKNQHTIAIRVPKHEGMRMLMKKSGPLFSTSANRSGEAIPSTIEQIDAHMWSAISVVVVDEAQDAQLPPSTIIDCTGDAIHIVREGAYPRAELEAQLGALGVTLRA